MKPIAAKALTKAGNSSMHDIMSDGAVWKSQALFPIHLETVWNGLKGVGISWHGPKPGMILTLYEGVREVCSNSVCSSGARGYGGKTEKVAEAHSAFHACTFPMAAGSDCRFSRCAVACSVHPWHARWLLSEKCNTWIEMERCTQPKELRRCTETASGSAPVSFSNPGPRIHVAIL